MLDARATEIQLVKDSFADAAADVANSCYLKGSLDVPKVLCRKKVWYTSGSHMN